MKLHRRTSLIKRTGLTRPKKHFITSWTLPLEWTEPGATVILAFRSESFMIDG
jgi:hypothetical protein